MLDTVPGGVGPPSGSHLSTQTVAESYRRRSKANLDKSDSRYLSMLAVLAYLLL